MATYLLVDTMNTFFRARHVVRGDAETKIGMAIHITLNAINKCYRKFNADHVLFALEDVVGAKTSILHTRRTEATSGQHRALVSKKRTHCSLKHTMTS